jgi:hypothetical protein
MARRSSLSSVQPAYGGKPALMIRRLSFNTASCSIDMCAYAGDPNDWSLEASSRALKVCTQCAQVDNKCGANTIMEDHPL